MNDSSRVFEIISHTLDRSENSLSISSLCRIAGVSRSGYYAWINAAPVREQQEQQDRRDFDLILAAYKMHGYSKGAKGIHMALLHMNPPVVMNLKKIRRLMDKFNLSCPYRRANPYRRMAKALKTSNVADNLLQREFESYGPRMVLLTDITYLPYNSTFAYLSTILDAFTKQILAYVLSPSLEVDFVLETVNNLVRDHGISLQAETIVHSDQGCHYTSHKFIHILYDKKLRQSMSRKGNCWDNAPQESFFGHMKDHIKEGLASSTTYDEIQTIVDDYIDYYNNRRYQWHLAKLSPNEYYQFVTTSVYPLDIPNVPSLPVIAKAPSQLGARTDPPEARNL
ncbi:MAG: IS3 family transposase [Eubacteriales bacterium]|nr:IS3 family transposase [Eubacteriales bacterium]